MRETKATLRSDLDREIDNRRRTQAAFDELKKAWEEDARARINAESTARTLRRTMMQEAQKWQAARSRMEAVITHLVGVIGSPDSMVRIEPPSVPQGYNVVMSDGVSKKAAEELGRALLKTTPLKDFP